MRTAWLSALVGGVFLVACADAADGGGGAGGDDPTGGTDEGGNGEGATNEGGEGTGGETPDACGNGVADAGESCDGTDLAGASCESQGFDGGDLFCTQSCTFDTGGCVRGSCGNDVIDDNEDCDGNLLDGQDCESLGYDGGTLACTLNCSFDVGLCTSDEACGNGAVEGAEECDDGNTLDGDGCSSACLIEGDVPPGWTCDPGFWNMADGCDCSCGAHDPDCDLPDQDLYCNEVLTDDGTICVNDVCVGPVCGDGTVDGNEECDDGNTVDGDGCSSICETEVPPGWTCDPIYYDNLDGCDCSCGAHDPDCDVAGQSLYCNELSAPPGTTCVNDVCVGPVCGNGTVEGNEACDDGNTTAGDGCSPTCTTEVPASWTCNSIYYDALDGCDCSCGAHDPDCDVAGQSLYCNEAAAPPGATCVNDVCVGLPVCGDGVVAGNEECDDGNTTGGDGCSATCTTEVPASWTCNPAYYDAVDGCDCECGAHDPDCDLAGQTLYCDEVIAPAGTVCNAQDICVP